MHRLHPFEGNGKRRSTPFGKSVVTLSIIAVWFCTLFPGAVLASNAYAALRQAGPPSSFNAPTNRLSVSGKAPVYPVAQIRNASFANAPPVSQSLYMINLGMSLVGSYGVTQSNLDKAAPPLGYLENATILSFGRPVQQSGVWGVIQVKTRGNFISLAVIESVIENYAAAYIAQGGGSIKLHIVAGVNNDTSLSGQPLLNAGAEWSRMINRVNDYFSANGWVQVFAEGGYDAEMGYNDPLTTKTWLDGFESIVSSASVYDYGNITCALFANDDGTTNPNCGAESYLTWTRDDIYYISWGCGSCRPFVQVYNQTIANEWYHLSLYAANSKGQQIQFEGVVTESGACQQHPADPTCVGTYTNPSDAWNDQTVSLGQGNPIANKPIIRSSIPWLSDVRDDV